MGHWRGELPEGGVGVSRGALVKPGPWKLRAGLGGAYQRTAAEGLRTKWIMPEAVQSLVLQLS